MKPTEEQLFCIERALAGDDIKVEARAGCAKTTTCALIAKQMKGKGLYTAFNSAIVDDSAKKLPSSVTAKTFHSLAFASHGRPFGERLKLRISGAIVANALGIQSVFVKNMVGVTIAVSAAKIGSLVLQTVNNFCSTLDPVILRKHAYIDESQIRGLSPDDVYQLQMAVFRYAEKLWPMMSEVNGTFPSNHSVYAKLYADSRPTIEADYILFDENQDADGLMLAVVGEQRAQKIWVGDSYQQIYAWRGAINAMKQIKSGTKCWLTKSFRFGAPIADVASRILEYSFGDKKGLVGFEEMQSRVGPVNRPNAIICRTNAQVAQEIFAIDPRIRISCTGLREAKNFYSQIGTYRAGGHGQGEFALLKTEDELREYASSMQGNDLIPYFNILDEMGLGAILSRFDTIVDAKQARRSDVDVTITTAHRSKGLEYDVVRLAPDFRTPSDEKAKDKDNPNPPTDEQMRLFYVAATRARMALDITRLDCSFLNEVEGKPPLGNDFRVSTHAPLSQFVTLNQGSKPSKDDENEIRAQILKKIEQSNATASAQKTDVDFSETRKSAIWALRNGSTIDEVMNNFADHLPIDMRLNLLENLRVIKSSLSA